MKPPFTEDIQAWRQRHAIAEDDPLVALVELLEIHLEHHLTGRPLRRSEAIPWWVLATSILLAATGGFFLGRFL